MMCTERGEESCKVREKRWGGDNEVSGEGNKGEYK